MLLAPCVDYVVVFSGLAGGSSHRLLAATPLLLGAQMLLLPALLFAFLCPDLADIVEPEPFVEAFAVLIVVPLVLAWTTQGLSKRSAAARRVTDLGSVGMVPLMMAVLFLVVASQIPKLDGNLEPVGEVAPFYVGFLAAMTGVGLLVARALKLDVPDTRAIMFTGSTRNSLVVLPLGLALPDAYAVVAVVIVAQTLVEVVGMVVLVRVVPVMAPEADRKRPDWTRTDATPS